MPQKLQKEQFKGGQIIQKELQRTISVYCWNQVYHLESLNKADKQGAKCMELYHHGNRKDKKSIGIVQQCLNGMPPFDVMFTRTLITDNLILKKEYHQMIDTTIIVSENQNDRGITLQLLSSTGLTNDIPLKGRIIRIMALKVIKNSMQALDLVKNSKYNQYINTGKLPSETEWEEYTRFLRIEMFKMLKKKTKKNNDDDNDDDNSEEGNNIDTDEAIKTAPKTDDNNDDIVVEENKDEFDEVKASQFIWSGYFAFITMGPIVPMNQDVNMRLECLCNVTNKESDDTDKQKKLTERTKEQKETTPRVDRKRSAASLDEGCGFNADEEIRLVQNNIMRASFVSQRENQELKQISESYKRRYEVIQNMLNIVTAQHDKYFNFLIERKPDIFDEEEKYEREGYTPYLVWKKARVDIDNYT